MKTLKILFTVMLTFVIVFTINAADSIFSVLAVKGDIKIQRGNNTNWDKVLTGTKINNNDKLKVGEGGYCGLVSQDGKTLELKKSGTYNSSELENVIKSKKSNVSSRLANYVANQIQGQGKIIDNDDYRNNMKITGSVERGLLQDTKPKDKTIAVNSPKRINLLSGDYLIKWQASKGVKKYKFILMDRFDTIVHTQEVSEPQYRINADKLGLEKDVYYFWYVTSAKDETIKSGDCCFMVYSPKAASALNDSLAELKSELGNMESALSQIVLAKFYEDNLMINEAEEAYKKALLIEPDVSEYKELYAAFTKRMKSE